MLGTCSGALRTIPCLETLAAIDTAPQWEIDETKEVQRNKSKRGVWRNGLEKMKETRTISLEKKR